MWWLPTLELTRSYNHKDIERHTATPLFHILKQWQMGHTSDLMMLRWSTYILTIIIREMGKLNTHDPVYCMKDTWENWLILRHKLDRMYLINISYVQHFQIDMMILRRRKVQTNKNDHRAMMYLVICGHHHHLYAVTGFIAVRPFDFY